MIQNTVTREMPPAGLRGNRAALDEHRFIALLVALVASALLLGMLMRFQPVSCSNDGSRWNTVWSLTNGRGYVIDDAPYVGVDKVQRADKHYYSSKPAMMPTVLAGGAWLIRRLAGWQIPEHAWIVIRLLLFFVNIIPFGVFIVFYARLIERYNLALPARLFCLMTAAFGTLLTAFTITLNNHTQAAIAAFLAIYCLVRILYDGQRQWYYFAFCGLFAAWSVVSDMLALVFALAVLVLLFRKHPRPTFAYFVPIATVLAAAYLYTNGLQTGTFIPFQARFNSELYQYAGGYWSAPRGIDALREPKWFYAFNIIIGHHGVFSLTPVFLLAFYGMWKDRQLRLVHMLGLGLTAFLFVFYLFKTNNYGGVTQGFRWLFWLIPFWLIGLAAAVRERFESRRFRLLAVALLLISLIPVGHALTGTKDFGRPGPWSASWLQILMNKAGWINY